MAKRRKKTKQLPWRCWSVKAHRDKIARTDGKKGFLDSLDVQISVRARIPRGLKIAARVIEQAIKFRCATGKNPEGFTIKIQRWRNPHRSKGSLSEVYRNQTESKGGRGWREYGPQKERFDTLGRALRGSSMVFKIAERRCSGRDGVRIEIVHRRGRRRKRTRKVSHATKRVPNRRGETKVDKVRPHKKGLARSRKTKRKARTR